MKFPLQKVLARLFLLGLCMVFIGIPLVSDAKIVKKKEPTEPALEVPVCVPSSPTPKVQIVSWEPRQKISKVLGSLTECVTTMWDVLKILPGPNIIDVEYPSEKERWGYIWMWSYELKNPIGETILLMDKPGKRLRKGKNPVELYLVFNKEDVLEKVQMILVKKSKIPRY